MAAIVFVTGVSTAGKTTVFKTLRADPELSDIEFHDIDEDGVPAAGSGFWRTFRVELLLHEAVARAREGISTVVCGVTKPHEAIEAESFPDDLPVHFILIDVAATNVRKRLAERLDGRRSVDGIQWTIQGNLHLRTLLRRSVAAQRTGIILNPGRMSRRRMCQEIKSIILGLL